MTNLVKNLFAAFILIAGISTAALAASDLAKLSDGDKYESLAWPQLKKEFLTGGKVEFDERVVVTGPDFAEDAMNVPVKFDASKLEKIGGGIDQIVVLVDRNPIKKVLVFEPNKVKAIL